MPPANYDGIPGNVSYSSPLTITGMSGSSPVIVSVSGSLPADFLSGALVTIRGVNGNAGTNTNGTFPATVTGASSFSIPVASSGAWTSGGTAQPLNATPLFTVPSDGDSDNAASIFPSLSTLGDRTQALAAATGLAKLAGTVVLVNSFGPSHDAAHLIAAALTAATWNQITCTNALTASFAGGDLSVASPGVPGQPTVWAVDGFQTGDDIHISMDCNAGPTASGGYLALWYGFGGTGGTVPSWPGGYTLLPGSDRIVTATTAVRCAGRLPHVGSGTLYLAPAFFADATATYTIALTDGLLLQVDAWRSTGVPQ